MKARLTASGLLVAGLALVAPASAQLARTNAIWARTAPPGSITLDGNLNEGVWATAESWRIHYRYDFSNPVTGTQGVPGSGWKDEGGFPPTSATNDSTNATLKFLVVGNQLYLGAVVPDKSIGGGGGFNYFDGFLMGLKDHSPTMGFPKPVNEYLYSWWYPRHSDLASPCSQAIDSAVGNPPIFKGRWAPDPVCGPDSLPRARSAEQIAAWDARTVVIGTTNSDAHGTDVSYTVEMRFDLGVMGYDVTDADGDVVEWNISIYDTDNWWKSPLGFDLSRNRTWWAGPWGNVAEHDEVRIYAKPSVTTASGPVPAIDPDFRIPNAGSLTAPTINGTLSESIWNLAPSFDIRWGDNALRASYPSVGKWRSGEFQPRLTVNSPSPAPLPFVVNGCDATVKYFFKGDMLYMGFDVRDQYVQSYNLEDRWDGFTVSITHRSEMDPQDHNMQGKALSFIVGTGGTASAQKNLAPLVGVGGTQVALALKPGTTLDTTGTSTDVGYTAELALNLTQLGFPTGLGDHTMFLGVTLHDGDSFGPPFSPTDSYATRAWWFREREEQCCPAWTYLDPALGLVVGVGDPEGPVSGFAALGNFPNPFRGLTRLKFALSRESAVSLEVFDLKGRLIAQRALGIFTAGVHEAPVQLGTARAGVYLYRLRVSDPESGSSLATLAGKMMVVR
jgi:hypothetical protein